MKKSEALSILGLSEGTSEEEIKKAHRKLVIENHPDKFGQNQTAREQAEEKTKLINEARDVLLSGKWDPEYTTAGTPYGAPFSYNPYTQSRPNASGGNNPYSGDPFDIFSDWPFTQTSFVWTTWDPVSGKKTTYTSSQNPFAHTSQASPFSTQTGNSQNSTQNSNPFSYRSSPKQSSTSRSPFNDPIMSSFFGFPFYTEPPTVDKQIEDAKTLLQRDAKFLVVKFALLALCIAVGFPASGLYLYTIISIGQGIYKRLGILSAFILAPFVLLAIIFAPAANGPIGIVGMICFALAFAFDISNIFQHLKVLRSLKKQKGSKQ